MQQDWVILSVLLFIALLLGWVLGRRTLKKHRESQAQSGIHSDYFKGLNYVLNEQPDKAIEVFVKMLEVDSETVETHLALGNLFRRRGEVDRAIRIHQNLIARPTLDREQRCMALLELGMDYMRSGLLDRAEGLFLELINLGSFSKRAYQELLDIYQQEKDWDKAINIAENMQIISTENLSQLIAQFYCEQAQELNSSNQVNEVRAKIRKALRMDPQCVRASILEGKLAQAQQKHRQAIKSFLRVEKQDPSFVSEIIEPLRQSHTALDKKDDYMNYLRRIVNDHGNITAILALVNLIANEEGEDKAVKFIITELQKRPSVRGVDCLIEYVVRLSEGETKESLMTIKRLTGQLLDEKPIYKCQHCGFDAKSLHWHCPSCKNWGIVKPVQGVVGE